MGIFLFGRSHLHRIADELARIADAAERIEDMLCAQDVQVSDEIGPETQEAILAFAEKYGVDVPKDQTDAVAAPARDEFTPKYCDNCAGVIPAKPGTIVIFRHGDMECVCPRCDQCNRTSPSRYGPGACECSSG